MKINPLSPLAALTILATAGAVIFAARPSEATPASGDWREASALINWKVGSKWTYKVSIPNSPDVTSTIEAVRTIRNDEGTVLEYLNTTTTPGGNEVKNYQYQLLGREGIFLVYNASVESDRPGYGDRALGPNIPATLDPDHKWNWDEPFRGQTMAGNAPGAAPPSPSTCFGQVVDRTQTVNTSMGEKSATVIAVEEKREGWSATTTSWYVEGIGMVKQET
ncbi:MAG: hypothetical protein KF812_07885, partial [Fimbriimonadaceae bacterium]|nr:hypothetical protein [Fimbriimonadaceae bacterium]